MSSSLETKLDSGRLLCHHLLYSFILYVHFLSSRPRSLQAVWPVLPAEVSKPTVAAWHWKPEWTESYIRGSVQS